jgi:hypothetical protein
VRACSIVSKVAFSQSRVSPTQNPKKPEKSDKPGKSEKSEKPKGGSVRACVRACVLSRFPLVASSHTKFLAIRQTNFADLIWKQQESEKETEAGGKAEDKRLQETATAHPPRFWGVLRSSCGRIVGPLGEWAMGEDERNAWHWWVFGGAFLFASVTRFGFSLLPTKSQSRVYSQ